MLTLILALIHLLEGAIFIRILWSWVDRSPYLDSAPKRLLWMITEPILSPVRNMLGQTGMFDFSAMVVLIFLQVIAQAIAQAYPY